MTVESTRRYYPGVDIVRFISALLVVFYHLGFGSWAKPGSNAARIIGHNFAMPTVGWIGVVGWVGVQIFFVVSGVVITQSANGRSPADFLKGRFYRLYPAVWICATITLIAALAYALPRGTVWTYVRSMLLLPGGPWVDAQYWTLPVELVFYGLVFLLLVTRAFRHVEKLAVGLIVLTAAYLAIISGIAGEGAANFSAERFTGARAYGLPFYHGCFFGLGILITLRSRGRISRLGLAAAALGLVTCCWQIYDKNMREAQDGVHLAYPLADLWPLGITVFLVAVAAIAWSTTERLAIDDQGNGLVRALGLTTYPLYLVHLTVGAVLLKALLRIMAPPIAFAVMLIVVVGFAMFVALVLEPRLRRSVRKGVDRIEAELPKPARLYAPEAGI
jgi:peptidoglycan/LPS O-acetylase OafA/YrhL